jgi:hypothetical protein
VASFHLWPCLGQVGQQQLQHHLLALAGARALRAHLLPGAGVRQQLGASVRSPSISTTQARQLPSGAQAVAVAQVGNQHAVAARGDQMVSPGAR